MQLRVKAKLEESRSNSIRLSNKYEISDNPNSNRSNLFKKQAQSNNSGNQEAKGGKGDQKNDPNNMKDNNIGALKGKDDENNMFISG